MIVTYALFTHLCPSFLWACMGQKGASGQYSIGANSKEAKKGMNDAQKIDSIPEKYKILGLESPVLNRIYISTLMAKLVGTAKESIA